MAKKQFLYENVYNDLKHKIECGDLKPGDKLEVEEDMITHYGVSAITVKKALNLRYQKPFCRLFYLKLLQRMDRLLYQRKRQFCHGIPGSWQD